LKRKNIFKDKVILVTGGTGSFGNYIVNRLIPLEPKEIRIFSRDEKKQFDMKNHYKNIKILSFFIGDIRDRSRLDSVCRGVDIIYQAAALKHVNACEEAPYEAVQTNIIGVENIVHCAVNNKVSKVIGVSTDKAVKPVNVMGMTKAVQERILISANKGFDSSSTIFCVVRYGNVLLSRGSIIPLFRGILKNKEKIKITDESMTRFLLTLDDAIDLVLYATEHTKGGEIFVKKAPSARIVRIAEILADEAGTELEYDLIGKFAGEKIDEILITEEELDRTIDKGDYFHINPFWVESENNPNLVEYSSGEEVVENKKFIQELISRADKRAKVVESDKGTYIKT
tara:strand:- start:161 stop:1183 length:1023 start_codon:yes stop_codon:yes gene_type:complete